MRGGRGRFPTGMVHSGQCCTSSPGLAFPGGSPDHAPQMGGSRPGSFKTKIESTAGNRTLLSTAAKASQVTPARRRPCKAANPFGVSSGEGVIRSSKRAFCFARSSEPRPEHAGPDHLVRRPARHKHAASLPAGAVLAAVTAPGEALLP
jgi:hypothetical protein